MKRPKLKSIIKESILLTEQEDVWGSSGCLIPDDPNFCSECQYDCVGEPHEGVVQTDLAQWLNWNTSTADDDYGHTCCCANDPAYNPSGEPQPENVWSACCYTNTNPGGTYTTDNFGQQDGSYYFTCDYWTDDYYWDNPNNPNYEQNIWNNSGCLDPDDPLFCSDCNYDCVGEPHSGVQTGAFGINWSTGNDDLGHTCCCQNDPEYNPWGTVTAGDVTSRCCFPNTNVGGGYTAPEEGICEDPVEGSGAYEGCMDPAADNFNPNATQDCIGNPQEGVQTTFGINFNIVNNDFFGNLCCCDYTNSSPSSTATSSEEAWACNDYYIYQNGENDFWNNYIWGEYSGCSRFDSLDYEQQISMCERWFNSTYPLGTSLNVAYYWSIGNDGIDAIYIQDYIFQQIQPQFNIGVGSDLQMINGGECCMKIGEITGDQGTVDQQYNDNTFNWIPFDVDVSGCMDSTATNYNPDATVDDGSCEYENEDDGGNTFVDPGKAPFANKPKKTPLIPKRPQMKGKLDEQVKRMQKLAGIKKSKK